MKISILTPTYNRAYTLPRLFNSLLTQTYTDFEWVLIDDGSTDDTISVVNDMIQKATFPVKFKKTANGGKHRAINIGVNLVAGEMILFLDSDDWLREDALELIVKIESTIPAEDKCRYAGVQGLRCHTNGEIVGSTFDGSMLDSTTINRKSFGIRGDKAEVYYTYLIRKYPFPEFDGEKFATERLVWNQIAAEGKLVRYFNEPIYYCEYLPDGLTYPGNRLYAANPQQWGLAIFQDYIYKDMNWYYTTVQIYIYYLWEKDTLSMKYISKYLHFSRLFVSTAIAIQCVLEPIRCILKGRTIKAVQSQTM